MKLNIAICDDDEAAIEYLKSCITHFYFAFDVEVSVSRRQVLVSHLDLVEHRDSLVW